MDTRRFKAIGTLRKRLIRADDRPASLHEVQAPCSRGEDRGVLMSEHDANLTSLFASVLEAQKFYDSKNTPEMQRRGETIRDEIPAVLEAASSTSGWSVEGRDGTGLKTRVPWIRVFDATSSPSATTGFYVAYLFAADGSGVALSLNQGTTDFVGGEFKQKDATQIRERVSQAQSVLGMEASDVVPISLMDSGDLGKGYERGHIWGRWYSASDLRSVDQMMDDLSDGLAKLKALDVLQRQQMVAVYVGRNSVPNLRHSLQSTVCKWGWKADQSDYTGISPGDLILFGVEYDGGSPRVQPEEYVTHGLRRLVVGRVTSTVAEEGEQYWPDEQGEVIYPHRLEFEVIEDRDGQAIGTLDDEFGGEVADGLRRSGISQSRGIVVEVQAMNDLQIDALPLDEVASAFADALRDSGRDYSARHELLVRSFLASLTTKRFLILTGLSGSGKTQLAQAFGHWLGQDSLNMLAVRPDWTSPEALLGFENKLTQRDEERGFGWDVPDALKFMLLAARDESNPYVLVLDEMNLAHVERYFADVLSGLESDEPILPNLTACEDGLWRRVNDKDLPLPKNLFVIGTVNVDETTYMFSPKVLDRASTIEFRVETEDLVVGGALARIAQAGANNAAGFLKAATAPPVTLDDTYLVGGLRQVHRLLAGHGREFGHRTFFESRVFAANLAAAGETSPVTALDLVILQKVLPKLHGSRMELTDLLDQLGSFCLETEAQAATAGASPFNSEADAELPRSFQKLARMAIRLRQNHFVSFTE